MRIFDLAGQITTTVGTSAFKALDGAAIPNHRTILDAVADGIEFYATVMDRTTGDSELGLYQRSGADAARSAVILALGPNATGPTDPVDFQAGDKEIFISAPTRRLSADEIPYAGDDVAFALGALATTTSTLTGDVSTLQGDVLAIQGWDFADVAPDDVTVEINALSLRVRDGGIDNAKIADGAVSNEKLDQMGPRTFKGNGTTSPAAPSDLGVSDVRGLLGVHPTLGNASWAKSSVGYGLPGYAPFSLTAVTIVANTTELTPFVAPDDCRLTDVGFMTSAGSASGVAQIYLYRGTWTVDGFQPTTRVATLATDVDTTTAGEFNFDVSALNLTLEKGAAYCIAIAVDQVITARRQQSEPPANNIQNTPTNVYQTITRVYCEVYPPPADLGAQPVVLAQQNTNSRPSIALAAVIKLGAL